MRVANYLNYALFEYTSNPSIDDEFTFGDVVINTSVTNGSGGKVGVIIQVQGDNNYRTDQFGNCYNEELRLATDEEIQNERPDLIGVNKGVHSGDCNITSCQKPNSAYWFNQSTEKYYCKSCALRLNSDVYNKRDALKLFGSDLCLLHKEAKV